MFSTFEGGFFGSHNPQTRFEKNRELADTLNLLKALKEKNKELKKAAANADVDNIAFPKHKVVSQVVSILDKEITAFNESPAFLQKKDELVDVRDLVDKLIETTLPILAANQSILFTPRDNRRKYANATIEFFTIGGIMTAVAFTTPLPWIAIPIAFVSSSVVSHYARKATGLDNIAPKSACILFDLISEFILIGRNVAESLGLSTKKYDEYIVEVIKICKEATENYLKQQEGNLKQENLETSEAGPIITSSSNELLYYSKPLQDFIRYLAKKPKFSDLIKDLDLPEEEEKALFKDYYDPTTGNIMNTPIRINGRLADLDATFRYPLDDKGRRTDPFNTSYIFYPQELKPDWQAAYEIEEKIRSLMVLKGENLPPIVRPG